MTAPKASTDGKRPRKAAASKRATTSQRSVRHAAGDGNGRIRNLVIVESPTKARTLGAILGSDYTLKASVGHVRDLPKSKLGVDVEHGFVPTYTVPREKKRVVDDIRAAARKAEHVFLATDPDREGEAISWHLVEAAELGNVPYRRVVFHEITPSAVHEAFRHPRDINLRLVDAQQARRVLDRLVGYKISPVLWSKIRRGLSAGRVQSVALRMVVEREREIRDFVPKEYWSIDASLTKEADGSGSGEFKASLQGPAGHRRKDFAIADQAAADALMRTLRTARYSVAEVRKRQQVRRPAPPFTTSTLQQEASRRLGFRPTRTMAVAQQLYEGIPLGDGTQTGLITYMRTDSTHVARAAQDEARAYIAERFGKAYAPAQPRAFRKKAKGAQEAHEAIRPTSIRREPDALRHHLSRDQLRLYGLIWQRMLASQMADAVFDITSVDIEARAAGATYLLRASDSAVRFPGYRRVYVEGSDDEAAAEERPSLPELAEGDALRLIDLLPEQHFTQPPPRFTEASLVKALEENGIGRPSTYAPTMATLRERGYVRTEGNRLVPEELGLVVNDLLTERFPDIIDVGYTAELEGELDEIAAGTRPWEPVIRHFYRPLEAMVRDAEKAPAVAEITERTCPKCGRPLAMKWGRFGQFLACTGYPDCRYTEPLPEEAEAQAKAAEGETCEVCGGPMVAKRGRFGPFLACAEHSDHPTRSIQKKIGVQCPLDGGDIVEKRTRKGRIFYGCNNYPRCDFTSWSRPMPELCPQCGGPIVAIGRGENARCTRCSWRGRPVAREAAATAGA